MSGNVDQTQVLMGSCSCRSTVSYTQSSLLLFLWCQAQQ